MFTNSNKYAIARVVLILALALGMIGVVPAQAAPVVTFGWARGIGSTATDINNAGAVDSAGNVISVGIFSGTVDFDPSGGVANLSAIGDVDAFISKLNANGNYIWARSLGGALEDGATDVAVDNTGNVYVGGIFYGTVDFDPGAGTSNLTSNGLSDFFLLKLDANGNFVWARSMGGSSYDSVNGLVVGTSGNIFVTGFFGSTVDFDPNAGVSELTSAGSNDVFVGKYDTNGNMIWAKNMGGTIGDSGRQIQLDGSGNVYTVGTYQGTADFDPGVGTANLTSAGQTDIFVSKLDSNGGYLWAKSMGGSTSDIGRALVLDGNGNVFVTGYFTGTADFDPNGLVYNLTSQGSKDIFISKLDGSGGFIFANGIGGVDNDEAMDVIQDVTGNIYVTGIFGAGAGGFVDFDPGSGSSFLNGSSDVFIAMYNGNGSFGWVKQLENSAYAIGNSLAISGNNLYGIGLFMGTTDFDPGAGVSNLTSNGMEDAFLVSLTVTPQIRYVKANATGLNNGSSWTNAYTDLHSALSAASAGDEIWVAAGTYKPTATTDRTISFTLKNGVALYGGFAGTETLRTQRDPSTNVTILSGEIGAVGTGDNAYHVVLGGGTDNTAIFDGFTVTAGNANGAFPYDAGGGMYNSSSNPSLTNLIFSGNSALSGGGMFNNNSSPSLTNVIFNSNSADDGGGMGNFTSSPSLTNVSFVANVASTSGGGISNYDTSSPSLINVLFNGNSAGSVGGGMVNVLNSGPSLTNVTFYNNSATSNGGAIGYSGNSGGSPTLINVTVKANTAANGGGIYNGNNSLTIKNSILWGNTNGDLVNFNSSAPSITYSIVQGGYAGTGNLSSDPLLQPLANNGGFTQTMALGSGSPAINAGTNTGCPATDQRGVTRPQGAACDIGAYEYNSASTFSGIGKWTGSFDLSHGWTVQDFVRTVGDVNGDGKADLVGFGLDGVYVGLSDGTSFAPTASKWTGAFDLAHGWTVQDFVRTVGDVNGDGKADLVGFGLDGVYVGLSDGTSFAPTASKWTGAFDLAHGWTVQDFVRTVGDVNGDGKADLVGFGLDGVYVGLSDGTSFAPTASKWTSAFDLAHGWTVKDFVRTVGDVSGDGITDLGGFGSDGVYVAPAH